MVISEIRNVDVDNNLPTGINDVWVLYIKQTCLWNTKKQFL